MNNTLKRLNPFYNRGTNLLVVVLFFTAGVLLASWQLWTVSISMALYGIFTMIDGYIAGLSRGIQVASDVVQKAVDEYVSENSLLTERHE